MSKFQITPVQKVVYTTEDGKQFTNVAEAEAHQFGLENAEKLELAAEAYLNKFGYKNRSRQQKKTIAVEFYSFFLAWDGAPIARTVMDDEVVAAPKADTITADDVPATDVEVEGAVEAEAPVAEATEANPSTVAQDDDGLF